MTAPGDQMLLLRAWSQGGRTGASSAVFSPCGAYRYDLRRTWDGALPPAVFIGLNPSKANATTDDHTIRKLLSFAGTWGCGGLIVLNLFALISTDPARLLKVSDPIGPENDRTLERVIGGFPAARLVVGWGASGPPGDRVQVVADLIRRLHPHVECFGHTDGGHPKHPLRLAYRTKLEPWRCA